MRESFEGAVRLLPAQLYRFNPGESFFYAACKSLYRAWCPKAKRLESWVGLRVETPLVERDGLMFYNRSKSEQWIFYVYVTIGDNEVWVENPKYRWVKVDEIEL